MSILRIFIILLVTEILLRGIFWSGILPEKVDKYVDQTLDWHQNGSMEIVNQSASYVRMKPNKQFQDLNQHGFHSPEIEFAKTGNKRRIAFVGGSTTFDKGPVDETYPYYASDYLNKRNFRNEFLNAGTSGYTSTESLISYYLRIEPFEPDLLVFYNARNDIFASGNRLYDPMDLTKRYQPPTINIPSRLHQMLSSASNLYAIASEVLGYNSLRINNWNLRSRFDPFFREETGSSKTVDEYIENVQNNCPELIYRKNLMTLAYLTKMNATELLLVGFDYNKNCPSSNSIPADRAMTNEEKEVLNDKILIFNRILEEVAIQFDHVYFYDLYGKIDRQEFIDDCHLTSKGKKLKGEMVGEYILNMSPLLAASD